MDREVWYQVFLFTVYFILGIICGVVFDSVRASNRIKKVSLLTVFIKDILFWIIVTILIFIFSLRFNDGVIRSYMIVAMLIGGALYFRTVSKYIVMLICFILLTLKRLFYILFAVPLRFLMRLINKPLFIAFSFSFGNFKKLIKKMKFNYKRLKLFKK